jgi:hypothetical protein
VLETEDTVKVEALQALLLEVRIYVSSCRIYEHALLLEVRHTTYFIYYMCPHTTIYAVKVEALQALLLLLYMCPHTAIYVSSY